MSSRLVLRLIAPTMALSVLLLGLGGAAAWYLHRRQKESSGRLAVNVAKAEIVGEMAVASHELRNNLSLFLLTGDPAQLDDNTKLHKDVDRWISTADSLADSPKEQELLAEIRSSYDRYFAESNGLTKAAAAQERPAVLALIRDVATAGILRPIHEYRDLNLDTMAETSRQGELIADRMGFGVLLLGASGAVAGLVAGFGIARGIQRSLVQLRVPIRDAAGKLNEVIGPFIVSPGENIPELDATLRTVLERVGDVVQRLQASQRAALRAEQMAAVGQLAAGLAHELRNPLTSMRVLVQAAAEQGQAAALDGRDLEVLDEEIMRMDRSIQAFLDFARPPKLEKRPLDPREVLAQTIRLVACRAENQGVRIEFQAPEEAMQIEADGGQVRQVLLGLLLNAMEAAPADGIIRVRLWQESDGRAAGEAPWVVVEVADSGAGLPPEVLDRLFEPFVTTKESGTGLGLTICKRIVEGHGGTIEAANRPQGGAVFTVRLPGCPGQGQENGSSQRAPET